MNLPAICNSCGTIFNSGFLANGGTISINNCTSGPCPSCGGIGNIPNGVYNIVNNTIKILKNKDYTKAELINFTDVLKKVKEEQVTLEEAESEIKDNLSGLSSILNLLPKNREETRDDIKFLLGFLIAIITLFATISGNSSEVNNINIEQVISVMEQVEENYSNVKNNIVYSSKIGRNELCPCGLGKKYKFCHGDWRNNLNEQSNNSGGLD